MKRSDVEQIPKDVEDLFGSALDLPDVVEVAIRKLFNVVEALCSDKQELMCEVDRLRKLLEGKKRGKNSPGATSPSNLSSDNRRPPDPESHLACCSIAGRVKNSKFTKRFLGSSAECGFEID